MNYLTNYYKNLSEQLSNKVKLLENYLYEMEAQISAGEPAQLTDGGMETYMAAPPNQSPQYPNPHQHTPLPPNGIPDPGPAPTRGPDEDPDSFSRRWKRWAEQKKIYDGYRTIPEKVREGQTPNQIFSWPERMPSEKVGKESRAVPPAQPGDFYVGPGGQVWYVDENNVWRPYRP